MKVAILWVGQQFYLLSLRKITSMDKHILSWSFPTVSHIKKASKLHKNGKPGNKKEENTVCKCECEIQKNIAFEYVKK